MLVCQRVLGVQWHYDGMFFFTVHGNNELENHHHAIYGM